MEDIPIVRLDDAELDDGGEMTSRLQQYKPTYLIFADAPAVRSKPLKASIRPGLEAPPPDFDRSGEMPDGISFSTPLPKELPSGLPPRAGLAAVDLLRDPPPTSRSSSMARYEEYKVDEADEMPIGGDVEVVRVRRKKKGAKEGRKNAEAV